MQPPLSKLKIKDNYKKKTWLTFVVSKPLMHICSISLKTHVFPSRMKIAKIIPIFKSDAKTDRGNHRPICLLPQVKKNGETVPYYVGQLCQR